MFKNFLHKKIHLQNANGLKNYFFFLFLKYSTIHKIIATAVTIIDSFSYGTKFLVKKILNGRKIKQPIAT